MNQVRRTQKNSVLFKLDNPKQIGSFCLPIEPADFPLQDYQALFINMGGEEKAAISKLGKMFPATGEIRQYTLGALGIPVLIYTNSDGSTGQEYFNNTEGKKLKVKIEMLNDSSHVSVFEGITCLYS